MKLHTLSAYSYKGKREEAALYHNQTAVLKSEFREFIE